VPAQTEYDELGRCISTEIYVVICSATKSGAVDPSTRREYKFYCTKCQSKRFYEGEDLDELFCVGCGELAGMRDLYDDEIC
jgi:hypothetical protein